MKVRMDAASWILLAALAALVVGLVVGAKVISLGSLAVVVATLIWGILGYIRGVNSHKQRAAEKKLDSAQD